jgi:hypothetical protein
MKISAVLFFKRIAFVPAFSLPRLTDRAGADIETEDQASEKRGLRGLGRFMQDIVFHNFLI